MLLIVYHVLNYVTLTAQGISVLLESFAKLLFNIFVNALQKNRALLI